MTAIYSMPGHLIRRLHQISASLFQEGMRRLGLDLTPVQFAALSVLKDNPGVDQATLAGLIAHDRVTIGGVVDRLEQKGLLQREVNTKDRRARVLLLSEAGQDLLERLAPVVARMQENILTGLTPAEREVFVALAAKVADAGNQLSRAPLVPIRPDAPDAP